MVTTLVQQATGKRHKEQQEDQQLNFYELCHVQRSFFFHSSELLVRYLK